MFGAAARDFLLEYGRGIRTGRATYDVDFGVRVKSWEEYERLVASLENSAHFKRDEIEPQRFHAPSSLFLDIVPFGPVAGRMEHIYWPPERFRGMSVEGFESANRSAVDVLLRAEPPLIVRTVSLAGLALLKLISWEGRYPDRGQDAYDFYIIMNSYMETANLDRLPTGAHDPGTEPMPPLQEIGARLLGQDMASICDEAAARLLEVILQREQAEERGLRLVGDMMVAARGSRSAREVLSMLQAVARGFSDIIMRP